MAAKKSLRVCANGHEYYQSGDCPVCETMKKPEDEFFSSLSAPTRRALENAGIKTPSQLSDCTEEQLLKLHGMGPASLPMLRSILKDHGLFLKKK
jgi:DNA-directed RNA polymerase alpha subunit